MSTTDRCFLSIAIPTYNGAKSLRETLNRIIAQLKEGVEIVVCDNASIDETPGIVKELQRSCPELYYHRNEVNLGFDRNVDRCVRRSHGNFVWLFADDDVMHNDAMATVLDIVKRPPPVCVVYVDSLRPYTVLDQDLPRVRGDDFFAITKFRSGGLSANVVNKSIWEQAALTPWLDSGFIHMAYLVETLANHPAYIHRGSLKHELDLGKRLGANHYFEAMLNLVEIYRRMPTLGYQAKTMRVGISAIRAGCWHKIPLAYKPNGLKVTPRILWRCIKFYRSYPLFWLIDLPLLLIPASFFKMLLEIYRIPFVKNCYRGLKCWTKKSNQRTSLRNVHSS